MRFVSPALLERCREREYVQSIALMYQMAGSQMLGEVSRAERLAREYLGERGLVGSGSHALVLQGLCFIYWSSADIRKLQQTASRMLALLQCRVHPGAGFPGAIYRGKPPAGRQRARFTPWASATHPSPPLSDRRIGNAGGAG